MNKSYFKNELTTKYPTALYSYMDGRNLFGSSRLSILRNSILAPSTQTTQSRCYITAHSDARSMRWKKCGWRQPWPVLRYYSNIYQRVLEEIFNILKSGPSFKSGAPQNVAGMKNHWDVQYVKCYGNKTHVSRKSWIKLFLVYYTSEKQAVLSILDMYLKHENHSLDANYLPQLPVPKHW